MQNAGNSSCFDHLVPLSRVPIEYPAASLSRVQWWQRSGHLKVAARLRGTARAGGVILFRREDVESLVANPPRRGRKPRGAL